MGILVPFVHRLVHVSSTYKVQILGDIYLWYPQAQLRSSNGDATSGSFLCGFPPVVCFPWLFCPGVRYLTLLDDGKRTDSGRVASYISIAGSPENKTPHSATPPTTPPATPQQFCPNSQNYPPFLLCCAIHLIGFGWLHRVGENLALASALQRLRRAQHGIHTTIFPRAPLAEATRRPLTLPCSSLHRIHSHLPSPGGTQRNSRAKAARQPVVKRTKKTLHPPRPVAWISWPFFPPPPPTPPVSGLEAIITPKRTLRTPSLPPPHIPPPALSLERCSH
ncbi:hypothetical protein BGX38DRAFT_846861 [Terfezia claveryi]|nr:hypothetical protein BGX38DRAFT_846861 [Terfezia claveryi]